MDRKKELLMPKYDDYQKSWDLNSDVEFLIGEVRDDDWQATLSTDLLLFGSDASVIAEQYQAAILDPNADTVSQFMQFLQETSKEKLAQALTGKEPLARWRLARQAYIYYAVGEVFTESSAFSDRVFEELRNIHGEDYLSVVERLDAQQPSEITGIETSKSDVVVDRWEQVYLELKKWQDIQHSYHESDGGIGTALAKEREAFDMWRNDAYPNLRAINAREALFAVEYFYAKQPILLSYVAKLASTGLIPKKVITTCLGGKNYGLAKLISIGARVPEAYAIPSDIEGAELAAYLPENGLLQSGQWAVRSSATVEDGEKTAFAGVFKSVLRVDAAHIEEAYGAVIESMHAPRVREYIEAFQTDEPHMSVVLQRFNEPEMSGVWLGSTDGADIEWVEGDGEKLVSGSVTPNSLHIEPGKKNVPPSMESVVQECSSIQSMLGELADLEWCVVDGRLFFVQFRPVTAEVSIESLGEEEVAEIKGMGASSGVADGIGYYAENAAGFAEISGDHILLADSTNPDFLSAMRTARGILTSEGGRLCHAAIVARELKKPCIVGAGSIIRSLHNKSIRINGTSGNVTIIE